MDRRQFLAAAAQTVTAVWIVRWHPRHDAPFGIGETETDRAAPTPPFGIGPDFEYPPPAHDGPITGPIITATRRG